MDRSRTDHRGRRCPRLRDPRPVRGGCPAGLNTLAFDVSDTIAPGTWYATLLKGTISFTPAMSVLSAIGWLAYVSIVMTLFILKVRTPKPARTTPVKEYAA